MRAIDVAPTISYLMRMPEPQNARGKIRLDMLSGTSRSAKSTSSTSATTTASSFRYEAADNLAGGGAANPVFAIGGSAFLKPWFDAYRAENPGRTITVTGDAAGRRRRSRPPSATSPRSSS